MKLTFHFVKATANYAVYEELTESLTDPHRTTGKLYFTQDGLREEGLVNPMAKGSAEWPEYLHFDIRAG